MARSREDDDPGDYLGISGDFKWRSADEQTEVVLRLQPGGKWWHAVHVQRPSNSLASKISWDESATWDMVESLGRWRLANIPVSDKAMPNSVAVHLTCESCRWASGEQGLPQAKAAMRASIDDMVESEQLTMDYVVQWCPETCLRSLVLHVADSNASHQNSCEDILSAIKALGFESTYNQFDETSSVPLQSGGHVGARNVSSAGRRSWGNGVAAMADGMRIASLCAGLRSREDADQQADDRFHDAIVVSEPPRESLPQPHELPGQSTHIAEPHAQADAAVHENTTPVDDKLDALGRRDSERQVDKVFSQIEDDLPYGSLDGSC